MKITSVAAAGAAATVLAGLGLGTAISAPAASASTAPAVTASRSNSLPVVPENCGPTASSQCGYYKPSRFFIMRGGPNVFTAHTHWPSWTQTSAQGSGKLYGVDQRRWYIGHVRLVFTDVKVSGNGVRYFDHLHIIGGHRNGGITHRWHWSFAQHNWAI